MMRNTDPYHRWVLTVHDGDEWETLAVFRWVGAAMGYVKHLTGSRERKWEGKSDEIKKVWQSVPQASDNFLVYSIFTAPYGPRADKAKKTVDD